MRSTPAQRYRARRVSEAIDAKLDETRGACVGEWMAFFMENGHTDNVCYESKQHAVRHQRHESHCAYIQIRPGGMNPREACAYLNATEHLYDRGLRMPDPAPALATRMGQTYLRNLA